MIGLANLNLFTKLLNKLISKTKIDMSMNPIKLYLLKNLILCSNPQLKEVQ